MPGDLPWSRECASGLSHADCPGTWRYSDPAIACFFPCLCSCHDAPAT